MFGMFGNPPIPTEGLGTIAGAAAKNGAGAGAGAGGGVNTGAGARAGLAIVGVPTFLDVNDAVKNCGAGAGAGAGIGAGTGACCITGV